MQVQPQQLLPFRSRKAMVGGFRDSDSKKGEENGEKGGGMKWEMGNGRWEIDGDDETLLEAVVCPRSIDPFRRRGPSILQCLCPRWLGSRLRSTSTTLLADAV